MAKKKASRKVTKNEQTEVVVFSARQWICLVLLVVAVGSSATGVVYSSHVSRHALNELKELERERNRLQVEWGQLLLEQSSLVSQGRVEEIALAELGMEIPTMEKVVVITGD